MTVLCDLEGQIGGWGSLRGGDIPPWGDSCQGWAEAGVGSDDDDDDESDLRQVETGERERGAGGAGELGRGRKGID
eukprot:181280-Hanusia_phi.AAC.3